VQFKQHLGPGDERLDYNETHAVVTRLNVALFGHWSWRVWEHKLVDTEVIVLGRLTVFGNTVVVKVALGS
jgi:hypothetical protein